MLTNNIFTEAAQTWDLDRIAREILELKTKAGIPAELTNLEKAILCALVCGHKPEQIARQLPGASSNLTVHIIWEIHDYLIEIAKGQLKRDLSDREDVVNLLSEAGYKLTSGNTSRAENASSFLQDETIVFPKATHQKPEPIPNQPDLQPTPQVTNPPQKPQPAIALKSNQITKYHANNKPNLAPATNNKGTPPALALAQYQPATVDTRLFPSLSRWTTIGGLVTMGLVGIALILAAIIKYDVTVKAQATVRPEGETKLVQSSKEGRIKSIEVKENQTVKQGDVIAYLDDTQLQTQKQQLTTNLSQSKDKLTQIEAQINTLETQIIAETNKSDRTIASARAELQRTQTQDRQDKLTTEAQVNEASARFNIAQQELAKAQTELQSARANLKSTEAALAAAIVKRDRYQEILASGAISQEKFDEAQLAVQQQEQTLESQKATVTGQQQTIERQKQEVAAATAQLDSAKAGINSDSAALEIAQQAIEREKASKDATIASYTREKEALKQQKIEVEKQIAQEQQQLQQIAEEIDQSTIRATADGKILQLALRNQNQVIDPQDTVAQIAPDDTDLVLKAQINPQDRDRLKVGQEVKLKLDACPYPDYGVLGGKLTAISADTIASENSEGQYYQADISPEAEALTQGTRDCQLRSGMTASADIITEAETPLQFFLRQAKLITQ